ncbi:uncharacterized protein METZ01_LOCUS181504, partial [marine metagenome]
PAQHQCLCPGKRLDRSGEGPQPGTRNYRRGSLHLFV